jgi:hypothetical protein
VWATPLRHLALCFACLTISVDAADIKVKTERDPEADFAAVRTYRWLPTAPYLNDVARDTRDPRLVQDALDGPIRAAVDRALAANRLKPAGRTDLPDCHVVYYAAFGVDMKADMLGAYYGYVTGWGRRPLGSGSVATSSDILEQGTLVVDILRSDRARAIWRGTATGAVDRTRTDDQRQRTIKTAVEQMFAEFPRAR